MKITASPPLKKVTPSFPAIPSKSWGPFKPPSFWKFAERGGGCTLCKLSENIRKVSMLLAKSRIIFLACFNWLELYNLPNLMPWRVFIDSDFFWFHILFLLLFFWIVLSVGFMENSTYFSKIFYYHYFAVFSSLSEGIILIFSQFKWVIGQINIRVTAHLMYKTCFSDCNSSCNSSYILTLIGCINLGFSDS